MSVWKVSTYYRKSCEQHSYFTHSDHSSPLIIKEGFRSCSYVIETEDDQRPQFLYQEVPGGDGRRDSIDLNNCCTNNIVESELDEMLDGWFGDYVFPEAMAEEEQHRLASILEEEGHFGLESEGWDLSDVECWVWGPLLIESESGELRSIVIADEEGKMIDFRDPESETTV